MIRQATNTAARLAITTIAALLAVIVCPSHAQDAAKPTSPRVIDFATCAKPEYPKADLRAEHTGTVTVLFFVAADGTVKDSKIAKSSGYETLDEAARTALATCHFAPASDSNAQTLWLPIQYRWAIDGLPSAAETPMSPGAQEQAFLWTARVLARFRYKPLGQVADTSAPVLDRYLKSLDPDRVLFTASEIAGLEPQREPLARNDNSGPLGAALAIFDQTRAHRIAMLTWTGEALHGPLGALETSQSGPRTADAPWPASDAERQALWRQHLAAEIRSLRSAGSSDKDIVDVLTKRNDHRLTRVRSLTTRDGFEGFMNAYVTAYDSHGAYFSPQGQAPFRAAEAGQAGVGLVLKKRGEWLTVYDMIGDGAAARSGQLHVGDRVVGVAQGAGQPIIDVVGWDLEEVVALLRGLPGSTVVLSVSPLRAPSTSAPRSVALVRGVTSGRDNSRHATAKLEVLERKGTSYRVGIVTIPSFYEDFAAKRAGVNDYASMTRDVAGLLATLKTQQADAVLLDMRGNGGGVLTEAIDFTGLFLPSAPVAQQRTSDGRITVESAPGSAAVWDGPLAVLIDEGSAAATEIFAAAMQDHGRGLVIGDRSIGRSSVQTVISLDRYSPNPSEKYGNLKLTVGQVYRVSGETFEQTGVIPDLVIPGVPDPSGVAHQLGFPSRPLKPLVFSQRPEVKALIPALTQRNRIRTAAGSDISEAQLGAALHIVGDEVELLRASTMAVH